jgi:hypothetical protein
MWFILFIFLATVYIILFELPYLLKKKLKKELWIFSILIIFAFGLGIAKGLNVQIPSPIIWVDIAFKPINHLIFDHFLK